MTDLPAGWGEIPLGAISSKIGSGSTPRGGSNVYQTSGIPLIRSMNIHFHGFRNDGLVYLDNKQAQKLDNVIVQENDVLLNITGASIGRVTMAPSNIAGARVNQHVSIIRLLDSIDPAFVQRFLSSPRMQNFIRAENYGMTRQALTKVMIERIKLPLPPLAEQRRIVEALDRHFARTRQARDELARIPLLIEHYKQAILSACYDRSVREGIRKCSLGEVATEIRNGVSRRPEHHRQGIPILKISAIRSMTVRLEEKRFYIPQDGEDISRYLLTSGDLLFTRYNGNPDLVANCGMLTDIDGPLIYPDKLIRVRVNKKIIEPKFIEALVAAPQARAELQPYIKSAAGQHGLSGQDLKTLSIPLPTLDQQREIIGTLKRELDAISAAEREVAKVGALLEHLDQGLLTRAFRGELVPHDPNDEPAERLLERIRKRRGACSTPRRGRRPKR